MCPQQTTSKACSPPSIQGNPTGFPAAGALDSLSPVLRWLTQSRATFIWCQRAAVDPTDGKDPSCTQQNKILRLGPEVPPIAIVPEVLSHLGIWPLENYSKRSKAIGKAGLTGVFFFSPLSLSEAFFTSKQRENKRLHLFIPFILSFHGSKSFHTVPKL